MGFNPVTLLFGAAGGTTGGRAASAVGAGSALEFSADGKGKSRHDPANFLALTFRASNLF
jgi:hypothetical protein